MSLSDLLGRSRETLAARFHSAEASPRILFFSLSDGTSRARIIRGTGADFAQAWTDGATRCQREAQRHKLAVRWLRVDWVVDTLATTWGELGARLALTKRNYFRLGLALDAELRFAFLEPELNANAMLYLGRHNVEAGVNRKNFTLYAQRRYGNTLEPDFSAQSPVYLFAHDGLFVADDPAIAALPDGDQPAWLPGAGATKLRWRNPEALNSGRRQIGSLAPEQVYALIDSSANFLARQVKKSGQFIYGHFPCFGRLIPTYNTLRHASSVYSMLEAWEFTRNDALLDAIRRALAYLSDTIVRRYPRDDGSTLAYNVDINGEIKLGANAVSLLALVKYDELTGDTRYRPLMEELALGIARMQDAATGRLTHVLNAEDLSVKDAFRIVYYDGEAAFGLMRLYGLTADPRWLAIVEKAFDHFIASDHWKHHDHWLSYCANELTLHKPEEKYFRFGVRNVAGYLDFILKRETTYPTLLELSMAFEAMLRRIDGEHPEMRHVLDGLDIEKFRRALHHRAHYLLNGFFWPELAMYFARPDTVVGSFFIRHHSFRVRIDDIEHYLSGYVAYWKMLTADSAKGDTGPPASQRPLPEHPDAARNAVGLLMYPENPQGFQEVKTYAQKAAGADIPVIYFSYRTADTEAGRLPGYRYQDGSWIKGVYAIPPIIDNAPPRNTREREIFERLTQKAFLTCHKLGGKHVTLPLLAGDPRTRKYTIPFQNLTGTSLREYLNEYGAVIAKPFRSNQGRNVYLLKQRPDGWTEVGTNETTMLMDAGQLDDFVRDRPASRWMIQRYVPSLDAQGRAFDIRVPVFRARNGRWRVARMYVRRGSGTVTSNLATGGAALDIRPFLSDLDSPEAADALIAELEAASHAIADVLQQSKNHIIDALGCDFGVAQGAIHLFEVNAYPGIKGCLREATDAKLAYHASLRKAQGGHPPHRFRNTLAVLKDL